MPQQMVDYVTAEGTVLTDPRISLPLGNWACIAAQQGATVLPPHSQTGPTGPTVVAVIVLVANFTGLFEVELRAAFSDGTTGGTTTHSFFTKQGATTGALTGGGVAAGKFGAGAAGIASVNGATAAAQILNVDAAGGAGILFEAASPTTIAQHSDAAGSLTGLLTANGPGCQNFGTGTMEIDSVGPTSLTKTPFTLQKPIAFALGVSATAAHVITYNSLAFFVRELPIL